jgi:hypothetical protein
MALINTTYFSNTTIQNVKILHEMPLALLHPTSKHQCHDTIEDRNLKTSKIVRLSVA